MLYKLIDKNFIKFLEIVIVFKIPLIFYLLLNHQKNFPF